MSLVRWLKVVVALRVKLKEKLSIDSPLLVRERRGSVIPMTAAFMSRMDRSYTHILNWGKATIHVDAGDLQRPRCDVVCTWQKSLLQ